MKPATVWTWAAETDAQKAFAHFEGAAPDGGVRFVAVTDRLVDVLQSFPFIAHSGLEVREKR